MPSLPLPPELDEFLRRPNPAVVSSLRPDGSPHTAATWYLWDGERVLLNMDESRLRLGFMRRDPRVALTVLDEGSWYRHVSLLGQVVEIAEDGSLEDIDRLALHYSGERFSNRDSRRVSAWFEPRSWHAWDGAQPWPVGLDLAAALEAGLDLIRRGEYFAAHEELEDAWRAAPEEERDFFQGLVHVAVAWYQAGRDNRVGCERQLEKAARRLGPYAPEHRGVDVAGLLSQVSAASKLVAGGSLALPPPKV